MAKISISGDTSGAVSIEAPAVAGSNTQTLVAATGTLAPLIRATSQLVSGQTSADFTNIPSWVKRITVVLNAVSTNGTSNIRVRLGYGSTPTYITTGYNTSGGQINAGTSTNTTGTTDGFIPSTGIVAANSYWGQFVLIDFAGTNNWNCSSIVSSTGGIAGYSAGNLNMGSDVLTAVRVTTVNGTDTFDGGAINILYE